MLLNAGLALAYFGAALFPCALLYIWKTDACERNYRPAEQPQFQLHLSTGVMLMLLAGAALLVSSEVWRSAHLSRYSADDSFKAILMLTIALWFIILEVFEYGSPDNVRIRRYRVIQCYPELKRIQNSTNNSRTGTPVTARSRAARPANLR